MHIIKESWALTDARRKLEKPRNEEKQRWS
jgi:hypothetical protein